MSKVREERMKTKKKKPNNQPTNQLTGFLGQWHKTSHNIHWFYICTYFVYTFLSPSFFFSLSLFFFLLSPLVYFPRDFSPAARERPAKWSWRPLFLNLYVNMYTRQPLAFASLFIEMKKENKMKKKKKHIGIYLTEQRMTLCICV